MDILNYRGLDYEDFRVPGEFEPQEAVILGWPEMAECIKGYSLHKAFAQLIKIIVEQAEGVTVYVNCPDQKRVESCRKALTEEEVEIEKVVITTYPDGSNWTRDYGPDILVDDKGHRLLANPRFNMYGQSTIDSVTSTLCDPSCVGNRMPGFCEFHPDYRRRRQGIQRQRCAHGIA